MKRKGESGVFLTVLGVGHDKLSIIKKWKSWLIMETVTFPYIDNILEAKKSTYHRDGWNASNDCKKMLKFKWSFNPSLVSSYRLIGYENRMLKNEDFANDAIDAGELGAGHTVTAIYEIIPAGVEEKHSDREPEKGLKYSKVKFEENKTYSNEMALMKFRYKRPKESKSILIEKVIFSKSAEQESSIDFKFSQAVLLNLD